MIEDNSYLHPTTRASAAASSSSCCVLYPLPEPKNLLCRSCHQSIQLLLLHRKNNTNARVTRANCSSCTTQGSWSSCMMCEEDKKTI
jgi:hypothetical protein